MAQIIALGAAWHQFRKINHKLFKVSSLPVETVEAGMAFALTTQ
jgi:hypothetical protein